MYSSYSYRTASYFRRVFIFGYFEQAFLCENEFLGPTVLREHIPTINNKMLVYTHVISFLQCECDCQRFNVTFIDTSSPKHCRSIGQLSKTLASASIRAANETVLATSKQQKSYRPGQRRSFRPRPITICGIIC